MKSIKKSRIYEAESPDRSPFYTGYNQLMMSDAVITHQSQPKVVVESVKTKAIFKIDPKLGPITIKSQLINKPCKLPKATTIESER
jgi:hypothetical protein